MLKIKSSIFALVVFAIFPGLLRSISITIVYDDHFYDSFEQGEQWEEIDPEEVKEFIEDRVRNDFSSYGIPVSVSQSAGPSLTVYIGRLFWPCQGLFGSATIGSYISGTTWCDVYSNEFACYDEWRGRDATISRIGEAISGTASHELGHVLNLYHAYMFDSFDPTLSGALTSFYQPNDPFYLENDCPSCVTDPNRHYHLMATTSNYISLEQRATINRYFADNSNQIILFAEADGADIYRNTTWGISNRTFTLLNDITVASDKTLIIAAGGYEHIIQAGRTNSFGTNAKLRVYGTLKAEGTVSDPITFTRSGASNWYGIRFEDSSVDADCIISYANIEYAKYGIYLYRASPAIEYSTITQTSIYGMYMYYSNPSISYNTIQNGNREGFYINRSSPTLLNNTIVYNGDDGIYAYRSTPKLGTGSNGDNGYNIIANNSGVGVYANVYTDVKMGACYNGNCHPGGGGNNSVYDNIANCSSCHGGPDEIHIWANGNSDVLAEGNWWGSDPPDDNALIATYSSAVDYTPWLSSDPNQGTLAGSGNDLTGNFDHFTLTGLELARYLQSQGNNTAAISEYQNIIRNNPNSAQSLHALRRIIECFPASAPNALIYYLNQMATNYFSGELGKLASQLIVDVLVADGQYQQAITRYEQILNNYPDDIELRKNILYSLGTIYSIDMNDQTRAVQAYSELLAIPNQCPEEGIIENVNGYLTAVGMLPKISQYNSGDKAGLAIPEDFALKQNYPNPFNPITNIGYQLPEESIVVITIYDLRGKEVKTLINGIINAGFKNVTWDSKDNNGKPVTSGLYFYRLDAVSKESNKEFHETKKVILLR